MDSLNVLSQTHNAVKLLEAAAGWVDAYDTSSTGRRRSACAWWNLQLRWTRKALASESSKARHKRVERIMGRSA